MDHVVNSLPTASPVTLALEQVRHDLIEEIETTGHVEHGYLGGSIDDVAPDIARCLGLNPNKPAGALVAQVMPNSPAARAGIKQGDVILDAGGPPVQSPHDLPRIVTQTKVGQQIPLTAERAGKREQLTATVGSLPSSEVVANEQPKGGATPQPSAASALDIPLGQLTPSVRQRPDLPQDATGAVVKGVAANSPAAELDVQPGDVILSIDQQPATSPQDAAIKLKTAANKGQVLLLINRDGNPELLALSTGTGPGPASGSSNPG